MNLLGKLTRLLIPAPCLLCGEGIARGGNLCPVCRGAIGRPGHRCPRCALTVVAAGVTCGRCLRRPPPFDRACAGLDYGPEVRLLIHRLKYAGDPSVLDDLLAPLRHQLADEAVLPDAIIPVPLHPARRRQRGFNQARLVADRLGRDLGLPVLSRAVRRREAGTPQSRRSAAERRRALRHAFAVDAPVPPRVAIVDDVLTTGSTAASLATRLRRAGAEQVSVWVLARTPPPEAH